MAVKKVMPDLLDETFMPDLLDTLNANGGSVSGNLLSFFTAAAIANPWSARKGIVSTQYPKLEYDDFEALRFGLELPSSIYNKFYGNPLNLFNIVKNDFEGLGYRHRLPRGQKTEPYRLSDFCTYWPNAVAPLKMVLPSRIAYTTEGDAVKETRFYLQSEYNWNEDMAELDGFGGVGYGINALALYPSSGGAGVDYRAGVLMVCGNTVAICFGDLCLQDPNGTNLLSLFAGQQVEMMPLISNIPESVLPPQITKVGLSDINWDNVETYALGDGIIKVNVDDENARVLQDEYNKAAIVEFNAFCHDRSRHSVAVRLILKNRNSDYGADLENLYVAAFDENGNRIDATMKAQGDVWLRPNEIKQYRLVINSESITEWSTIRLYWGGIEMRAEPIHYNHYEY